MEEEVKNVTIGVPSISDVQIKLKLTKEQWEQAWILQHFMETNNRQKQRRMERDWEEYIK